MKCPPSPHPPYPTDPHHLPRLLPEAQSTGVHRRGQCPERVRRTAQLWHLWPAGCHGAARLLLGPVTQEDLGGKIKGLEGKGSDDWCTVGVFKGLCLGGGSQITGTFSLQPFHPSFSFTLTFVCINVISGDWYLGIKGGVD